MKDRGGLVYPIKTIRDLCESAEKTIKERVSDKPTRIAVKELVRSATDDWRNRGNSFNGNCGSENAPKQGLHLRQVIEVIARRYITIRLHTINKTFTLMTKGISDRNYWNKLLHFKGH
jgi:hypothetical protein